MKKYLILAVVAGCIGLSACGTVTPYGAMVAGTDADEIEVSGNIKTGDYKLKAKGFNQSKSTEKVADTFRLIKQVEVVGDVTKAGIGEAGSVATEFAQ